MHIAFLGDSLTEGRPGAAYFPLLQERLPRHELLNLGRAGDTVSDLLRRVTHRGLDPVDAAFIWVGVNDAVMDAGDAVGDGAERRWGERLTQARGDYEQIVQWTAARTARIVCVRPMVLEADGTVWQEHADELGDVIAAVAGAHNGARALDMRPAFAAAGKAGAGPFTTDGVHFTDAGATVVAAAFAAGVEDIERDDLATPETRG